MADLFAGRFEVVNPGAAIAHVSGGAATRPPRALALKYDSQYEFPMERVTATLDEDTLSAIRRVAGPRGVSAFLQIAARERLARLEILGLLDELDRKHGAPSAEVCAEVDGTARRVFRR